MRFTDSSDPEQRRKREKRGHIDKEEREQIRQMHVARAAGNHTQADEVLDQLLQSYWHEVERVADHLEGRGEVRDDALSAGAIKLVYTLTHFDPTKETRVDEYVHFSLSPSHVVTRIPKRGVARYDRQHHITNMPADFWQEVPDPRTLRSADSGEKIADTLWELVQTLKPRLLTIIEQRYFEVPQRTHAEIAPLIGVGERERVRQLEVVAIESLRIRAEASGLRDLVGLTAEELQDLLLALKGRPAGEGYNMPAGGPGKRGPRPKKS